MQESVIQLPDSPLVEKLSSSLPELCAAAERCTLWDVDSYNHAADLAKFLSESVKTIESERKRITQPLNESLRATNGLFKKLSDPVEAALTLVKGKILRFKLEEQKRVDEKLAELKAMELAQSQSAEPSRPEAVDAQSLNAVGHEAVTSARGGFGSVSTQKRWTFRVKDKLEVPPVYLLVDEKRVNQAIRDGMRDIPGLEIYQEEIAVVR